METNDEQGSGAQGPTGIGRSKKQRLSRKARGLTCANCRAKKVRCEGSQPTCKTCEVYHVECHYDKPPALSQVVAMARRLQEAEETIERLQSADLSINHQQDIGLPAVESVALGSPPAAARAIASQIPLSGHTVEPAASNSSPTADLNRSRHQQDAPRPTAPIDSMPQEPLAIDLSVDEHGKICYYGPTSAVHEPLGLASPSTNSLSLGDGSKRTDVRAYLLSRARESTIWEEFALGNAALQLGLSRQVMAKLLHLHWTWVAPMFMWVYRPAFMRDMTTGGRYYSDLLLLVLCAHASKYHDGTHAQLLFSRVRLLLGEEIQKPSSIPTIQALLQLSARELAQGAISQAWLYSGMAFRMSADLGLQHNGPDIADLKGLDPVDLEIRKRECLVDTIHRRAISLYTGRLPAVIELPQGPIDFMDDTAESEIWAITESSLNDIKVRLDTWRAESPAHLRYDPENLPPNCPPPHIISQNILYFTTVILAHRPFWSVPSYYQVCMNAAQSMEKLLLMLETTFGFENITYLMGYCIYTGASAVLEDAKNNDGATHPTMQTFLRALNRGMAKCPLLERSLHIIVKGLKRAPVQRTTPDQSLSDNAVFATINSYIPAFPYLDPVSPNDFDMGAYINSMSMDAMASLDCYPELQIDLDEIMR
ncbi:unnamed protein product [Fusarium equiseti]|uniref:Zn(2)-C6 fungal-type domain-containing protein n=1 Tax=Fusarium equiseti TaxID=61235 RepID=A0A8J2NK41_FUSEQ|nr:unnamed protein product [Fusarium equiseti]